MCDVVVGLFCFVSFFFAWPFFWLFSVVLFLFCFDCCRCLPLSCCCCCCCCCCCEEIYRQMLRCISAWLLPILVCAPHTASPVCLRCGRNLIVTVFYSETSRYKVGLSENRVFLISFSAIVREYRRFIAFYGRSD